MPKFPLDNSFRFRNQKETMSKIVSVSIEMLLEKLASEAVVLFARRERIHDYLVQWKKTLEKIKAVIEDAEEKQTREESVKMWLCELQNLAYDVEDLLGEFETEALRRKLLLEPAAADHHQPSTSKFPKLIRTWGTNLGLPSIKLDYKVVSKVEEVNARLQDIAMQIQPLDLREKYGGRSKRFRQRRPTTSLVHEAKVYGRSKEREEIVELLLKEEGTSHNNNHFSVVSIIGMGGLGKTTLAQLVYNDSRVQCHFDLKAWTYVSQDFDIIRVTKSILRSVAMGIVDHNDLNLLQWKLKKQLFGKRFLLVFDDVWNENYNDWIDLSRPFQDGAPGSKIIITTRNADTALMMGTVQAYPLKGLSNDDCVCLFTQHSLETRDFSMHQPLKEIGAKIVIKCNGLPLAAKALGCLLHGKYDPSDWESVLNSRIWDLSQGRCDIVHTLALSYHYLSRPLKKCFAYCSLFPKDYEFQEEETILLWMAEGFLGDEDNYKKMEDLGRKFFRDLHAKSFFQQSSCDTSRFVMHHLINDLAQWAAGDIYFRMGDVLEDHKRHRFSENLRHFSYLRGGYDGLKMFEVLSDAKRLRTFLPLVLSNTWSGKAYLAHSVLYMLFKLQRLRVLSLRGYSIFHVPSSIGDLKHLQYLDLSETKIKTLPESVNKLWNLHTLLLENCHRLKKLCANMGSLIKLHHLKNSNVKALEEMPKGIGNLTHLLTLSRFVVGKDVGSGLQTLKLLKHLQGTLDISKLENVKDASEAKEAQLIEKRNLLRLLLEWTSSTSDDPMEHENVTLMLDGLKPHRNLEELTIRGYGGTTFPTWIGDSSFTNLVLLRFEGCHRCTSLPSVGQLPLLKHLFIIEMTSVKMVGSEFYGNHCSVPFPSLETLCFQDIREWEGWIPHGSGKEVNVFPQLRELSLIGCPKLQGRLPECLSSLERLVVRGCEQLTVLVSSLPKLCKLEIGGCKGMAWRSTNDVNRCCPQLLWLIAEEEQDQQQPVFPCSLQYLELSQCRYLVKLPQALLSLGFLREMEIYGCPSLVSFPEALLPSRLRTIKIVQCSALESLPDTWMDNPNTSLDRLYIAHCNSLTHIAQVQLHPSLKWLHISNCNRLGNLIKEESIQSSSTRYTSLLEYLYIDDCASLTSLLPKNELPATLEHLHVKSCGNLAFLSLVGNLPKALKYLSVDHCLKLKSLAERLDNNSSLEAVKISYCENLIVLPDGLLKLNHLQEIFISHCPNLISFPDGGFLSSTLTKLWIYECEKLKALPNGMHNLTSLQELEIGDLPSMVCFPEDGFPTNLHSLEIRDMKMWKSLIEWEPLNRFTSLKRLSIHGCQDMVTFPQENIGMMLPASLTKLEIVRFSNLEYLSSVGESLPSLECLILDDCPKLRYFPDKGLPPSLLQLHISNCPLIEESCRKDGGQYWHLISNIPCVYINFRCVFDVSD